MGRHTRVTKIPRPPPWRTPTSRSASRCCDLLNAILAPVAKKRADVELVLVSSPARIPRSLLQFAPVERSCLHLNGENLATGWEVGNKIWSVQMGGADHTGHAGCAHRAKDTRSQELSEVSDQCGGKVLLVVSPPSSPEELVEEIGQRGIERAPVAFEVGPEQSGSRLIHSNQTHRCGTGPYPVRDLVKVVTQVKFRCADVESEIPHSFLPEVSATLQPPSNLHQRTPPCRTSWFPPIRVQAERRAPVVAHEENPEGGTSAIVSSAMAKRRSPAQGGCPGRPVQALKAGRTPTSARSGW